jgi:hypothetical protein
VEPLHTSIHNFLRPLWLPVTLHRYIVSISACRPKKRAIKELKKSGGDTKVDLDVEICSLLSFVRTVADVANGHCADIWRLGFGILAQSPRNCDHRHTKAPPHFPSTPQPNVKRFGARTQSALVSLVSEAIAALSRLEPRRASPGIGISCHLMPLSSCLS